MKLRILSLNVRRANNRDKIRFIKSLINAQKANLVCLQVTKIQSMSCSLVRSLGVGRFLEWGTLDSRGMVGGVSFLG